jgi:hypothetical protein
MNEKEAFIKVYRKIVAVAPDDILESFLDRYHEDHDVLYEQFGEYYTNIMDALGMWEAGIKFAQKQQKENASV